MSKYINLFLTVRNELLSLLREYAQIFALVPTVDAMQNSVARAHYFDALRRLATSGILLKMIDPGILRCNIPSESII